MPQDTVTHLERRKIQAEVLIPMVQAFQRAIAKEHPVYALWAVLFFSGRRCDEFIDKSAVFTGE